MPKALGAVLTGLDDLSRRRRRLAHGQPVLGTGERQVHERGERLGSRVPRDDVGTGGGIEREQRHGALEQRRHDAVQSLEPGDEPGGPVADDDRGTGDGVRQP
ncbi:hypothetical protein O1M54_07650 [Streptomyces diastatochromogenes]|nr:hypothetical protein [Streptomyces diastatochromogenes]